ncbi:MAG: hypothetical protein II649_03625 [Kiritimatiellae bacterium]|nr:hypothetical protein [Kiritimatiellia bacterium]
MKLAILMVSLLVLAYVLVTSSGSCKQLPNVAKFEQVSDPQIAELKEAFKRFATWQKYMDAFHQVRFWGDHIGTKINRIKDPVVRMEYFRKFSDLAFSVQIDASDSTTRSYQLKSFNIMTDEAKTCASVYNDVNSQWDITFRRLKTFKKEMQAVETFFEGKGGLETFKGERDEWQDYRRKVKGAYKNEDKIVSHYFRDTRTADGLTYERWHYLHSQFEEILGHKVEVWSSVLEKWEKERKRRAALGKTEESK